MEAEILSAAKLIAGSIESPNWAAIWTQLVSVFLGAFVAWVASAWTARYAIKKRDEEIRKSVSLALAIEIKCILTYIEASIADSSEFDRVIADRMSERDTLCPIYLASASSVGLLNSDQAEAAASFYGNLLLMRPTSDMRKVAGAERFYYLKADFSSCADLAKAAIISLKGAA